MGFIHNSSEWQKAPHATMNKSIITRVKGRAAVDTEPPHPPSTPRLGTRSAFLVIVHVINFTANMKRIKAAGSLSQAPAPAAVCGGKGKKEKKRNKVCVVRAGACCGGEAFVWVLPALLKKHSFGGGALHIRFEAPFCAGEPRGALCEFVICC